MKRTSMIACLIIAMAVYGYAQEKTAQRLADRVEVGIPRSPAGFTYTFTVFSEAYEELTGATSINQGEVWDDPEYVVPVPFPFTINGNMISEVEFAGLGGELVAGTSNSLRLEILAPFGTDLIDRGYPDGPSQSPLSYRVDGTPGSRILKVEWKNAGSYDEMFFLGTLNMHISFQIWLYEGSNRIEYRFGTQMIDNPEIYYAGESGAYIGFTGLDLGIFQEVDVHFLTGQAANPSLTESIVPVTGTPPEGLVYRFEPETSRTREYDPAVLMIYPNPVRGSATITASRPGPYDYMLIAADGRMITSGVSDGESIELSFVDPGVYLLKVIIGEEISVHKIVVAK